MKKIISSLMIIVILFNFILYNNSYVYAETDFEGTDSITPDAIKSEDVMGIIKDGATKIFTFPWNILGAIFGTIAGILAVVANLFPTIVEACMMLVCNQLEFVTIENMVFNKIGIFNVNYFNFGDSYKIGDETIEIPDIIKTLRESIAKNFYILKLLAIAISLLTLIYVGIRMALSSTSQDKAKYKKMLIGWIESVLILFFIQYIISIIFKVGDIFEGIIYDLKVGLDSNGERSFENKIIDDITSNMLGSSGWTYALNSVAYWFLMFVQTKFFLAYFKRTIVVAFLTLISPLITVTYPIDKIGDGKAQAFWTWLSELAVNVFIQPIHALIYLVFIYTAGEIAKYSMLIALIFLLSLTKIEKIVLQLFNLKNIVSLPRVDDQRKKRK